MAAPATTEPGTLRRSQTKDAESVLNTRQDRGIFVTGGGLWTWDAAAGTLTWTDTIEVFVSSLGSHSIGAGACGGLDSSGKCCRAVVDRESSSALTLVSDPIDSDVLFSDTVIPFAVRAKDDRLHFRDGTVFNHGETKRIGTSEQSLDRIYSTVSSVRAIHPVGNETHNEADGIVLVTSTRTFTSALGNFNTNVPNTLGEPDTLSYLHIEGDGVYKIETVVSNVELYLETPAAVGTGLVYQVYDQGFEYISGKGQLLIHVNGVVKTRGIDYNEVGAPDSTQKEVTFIASKEPTIGQVIEFINVSGGQGPQGDAGVVSFQDAYESGREVSGTPAKGAIELDWPTGTDVVLLTRTGGGPPSSQLHADGVLEISKLWIPDGAGNRYELYGSGGELLIKHSISGKGVKISDQGEISPFDVPSVALGFLKWAEYGGTFGSPAAAVTIATGIPNLRGAILAIEDGGSSRYYMAEFNRASTASAVALVSADLSTGHVYIDGDFAGGNLGSDFDNYDYRLLVFYG